MSNDEIRTELSDIAIKLTELPEDDFSTRAELRDRRLALRNEIGKRPMAPEDVASMRRELVGLQRRLDEIFEDRPNVAGMADGGEGQAGLAESQRLGWEYDAGQGRNAIEERIMFLQHRIHDAEPDA